MTTQAIDATPAEACNLPAPRRTRARPATLVWISKIVLGLLIAVTTSVVVMHLRESALLQAERELQSLAFVLADQAERAFEAVDLAQTNILGSLQSDGIRTQQDFAVRASGIEVHDKLVAQSALLPQLDIIGLAGVQGDILNVVHAWPVPHVNIGDRPYFKMLKDNPDRETFVSEPFTNRLTGIEAVVIGRRFSGEHREFLGISFAGMQTGYFERLYQTVVNRPAMAVALLRSDGALLARYPRLSPGAIRPYGKGAITAILAGSGADHGVMRQFNQVDGAERMIAGHRLAHFPMVVSVSATIPSILVSWQQQALSLIGAAILLELVAATVGILVLWQLRSQRLLTEARAVNAEAQARLAVAHAHKRADHIVQLQNLRFDAALSNMSHALCMFDSQGRLVVANRRVSEIFGLPASAIEPGMGVLDIKARLAEGSNLSPSDVAALYHGLTRCRLCNQCDSRVRDLSDGRSLAMNFAGVEDDGWLVTFEDITDRRQVEARMMHMAHHDALTGLPNRVLFHDRLAEAVARSRRGEGGAVLFLDLDHFKAVNDTLGHPVGDALLREVTQRLVREVRDTDIVARLGGDEFAVVQSSVDQPADVTSLARRLIDVLSAPYELDGQAVSIGTSVGIALIPSDGDDPDQLLKHADLALYRAKADGRGRYRFFEPEMDRVMQARRALELDLRQALMENQFEVFYQPCINLETRSVCGFEALLRWRHPERGMVMPDKFIPFAEETGLIVKLGEWVLRRACLDAAGWPERLRVAVNLSPVQFGSHTLVDDVDSALRESGLAPERLELEITEAVMLEDSEMVVAMLHRLRKIGVRIAMDDFGTGHSSLSYLQRFRFDKLKIDRSFISGLGTGGDCDAIVSAVTGLCETMGIVTTAEGVETPGQLQQLAALRCTEAQGFLFSVPRPAADVAAMCRALGTAKSDYAEAVA